MFGMHGIGEDSAQLKEDIRHWGRELGFDAVGFSAPHVTAAEDDLRAWLAAGCHGEMDYMSRHVTDATGGAGNKRAQPTALVPGTRSIITARMNYRPAGADSCAT